MNSHQSYACVTSAYLTRYLRKRELHSTTGVADGYGSCSMVSEDDITLNRFDGSQTVNTNTHTNTWPDLSGLEIEYVSHTVDSNTTTRQKVTVQWRDKNNPSGTYWTEVYDYELYTADEYTSAQFETDCSNLYAAYLTDDMIDDAVAPYSSNPDTFNHVVYYESDGSVLIASGSSAVQGGVIIGGTGWLCSDVTYTDGSGSHAVDASYMVDYPFPTTTTPHFKGFKRVKLVDGVQGCIGDYQLETGVNFRTVQASWTWPCAGSFGSETCSNMGQPAVTFIGVECASAGYVILVPGNCP